MQLIESMLEINNSVPFASITLSVISANHFIISSFIKWITGIATVTLLLITIRIIFNRWLRTRENKFLTHIKAVSDELSESNDRLESVSSQKKWLLNELQHSVNNNLQMVSSLLNIQGTYLESAEAVRVVRKSRHRLFAISLAHQKVYMEDSLSRLDAGQYLPEIVSYLREEFDVGEEIEIKLDMIALNLCVSHAVPLGLIVNEAVSNSFEYAFPDHNGRIEISLYRLNDGCYRLDISDNGVGYAEPSGNVRPTLGTTLMEGLSFQLGAAFEQSSTAGVRIRVDFKL